MILYSISFKIPVQKILFCLLTILINWYEILTPQKRKNSLSFWSKCSKNAQMWKSYLLFESRLSLLKGLIKFNSNLTLMIEKKLSVYFNNTILNHNLKKIIFAHLFQLKKISQQSMNKQLWRKDKKKLNHVNLYK